MARRKVRYRACVSVVMVDEQRPEGGTAIREVVPQTVIGEDYWFDRIYRLVEACAALGRDGGWQTDPAKKPGGGADNAVGVDCDTGQEQADGEVVDLPATGRDGG